MPRTAPRDVSFSTADLKPVIYTPEALPMFADKKYGESQHQKEKRAKKFKPMEPVSGVGKGGRLGGSATAGFVQTLFSSEAQKNEDVSGSCRRGSWSVRLTGCSPAKRSSNMRTRRTTRSDQHGLCMDGALVVLHLVL
jgi:hypothetical protein